MMRLALVGLLAVALVGSGCGVLPGTGSAPPTPSSAPPATQAGPSPSPQASPAASPSPVAGSSPTTAGATSAAKPTAAANTVYVGNTDGEGVYVRQTPAMDDKVRAYADGTALTIIGDDVDGDGQHWKHVRTPDGLEGYVPSQYTTSTPQ